MTAHTYTVLAYVVVGVLMWGYAGMLMLRRTRSASGGCGSSGADESRDA
jgi:hypothetical protein